jgi:hypothetical protein
MTTSAADDAGAGGSVAAAVMATVAVTVTVTVAVTVMGTVTVVAATAAAGVIAAEVESARVGHHGRLGVSCRLTSCWSEPAIRWVRAWRMNRWIVYVTAKYRVSDAVPMPACEPLPSTR